MKKIAIFGGSFDPVHNAHVQIAKLAVQSFGLDKIIFVIAYAPAHKTKQYADISDRSKMLELAVNGLPKTEISFFEAEQKTTVYSYQTLDHFQNLYPNDEIFMIIGSDSLLELPAWKNINYLAQKYKFIVAKRPNTEISKDTPYYNRCIFIETPAKDISSTEIRKMISQNDKKAAELLDDKVYGYIKEHNLYMMAK
ncbi:nicotinate (nicotinamide) nucleotide adenylyltransferase [Endomicrobium proavitum]|uniref:Probable nicotinate-nucleotide adenylyltransferase n=1 Tax=Endomicrobium proavitum TaxID=1408281 RepID=A0A0G3WI64_9BACT|nr:nicotinate (nicotinamide) nucleotide adenylyltransferase [Endomicrobium proavitum]AKL98381.1 putative nicotinate-nucleotide adenylyltransferase [Endomicrobium proavitum]